MFPPHPELCGTPGYLAPEVLAHSMYENVSGYGKEVDMWVQAFIFSSFEMFFCQSICLCMCFSNSFSFFPSSPFFLQQYSRLSLYWLLFFLLTWNFFIHYYGYFFLSCLSWGGGGVPFSLCYKLAPIPVMSLFCKLSLKWN